jgi:hypothetical protein
MQRVAMHLRQGLAAALELETMESLRTKQGKEPMHKIAKRLKPVDVGLDRTIGCFCKP